MTARCQQSLITAAEYDLTDEGPTYRTIVEVQRCVDRLRDVPWWRRTYAMIRHVEVQRITSRRFDGLARWDGDLRVGAIGVTIPASTLTIAHELAHVLTDARFPGARRHGHDPAFARVYGETVYHMLGSRTWEQLRRAYDRHGVAYDAEVSA